MQLRHILLFVKFTYFYITAFAIAHSWHVVKFLLKTYDFCLIRSKITKIFDVGNEIGATEVLKCFDFLKIYLIFSITKITCFSRYIFGCIPEKLQTASLNDHCRTCSVTKIEKGSFIFSKTFFLYKIIKPSIKVDLHIKKKLILFFSVLSVRFAAGVCS